MLRSGRSQASAKVLYKKNLIFFIEIWKMGLRFFGNVLRYQVTFLPKTKMVPVVHMNIFYRMDLEIYDSKSEL